MSQNAGFGPSNFPGGFVQTLTGNIGGAVPPIGGNINIVTANTNVLVAGNPGTATLTLDFAASTNLLLGSDGAITSGTNNTGLGEDALFAVSSGSANTAIGHVAGAAITSGIGNVLLGAGAADSLITGSLNTILGTNAGSALTGAESSNIYIKNSGVLGESNVIRIGTAGSGAGQQDECFIVGIDGVNLSSANVVTEVGNQLGTAAITAGAGIAISTATPNQIIISSSGGGSGITTIDGDTGSVTGATVSLKGNGATNAGSSVSFSGAGTAMTFNTTDASQNTIIGLGSGNSANTASFNTALGQVVMPSITSAEGNTAVGQNVFPILTSGTFNTSIGNGGAQGLTTGNYNTFCGVNAGNAYTNGNESANIILGVNRGVVGDANTIRIGNDGSAAPASSSTYIYGIDGVNVGSTANIVTEVSNKLGTALLTAGTGISITPGANTITIATTGTTNLTYTNVSATPYVVLSTDEYLSVDTSALAITVQLPNAATLGKVFIIKDRIGAAATRNITVTTVGGAVNIDGATTFVMNTNFQAIQVIGNGSTYEIF